jgi:hypothetical protein
MVRDTDAVCVTVRVTVDEVSSWVGAPHAAKIAAPMLIALAVANPRRMGADIDLLCMGRPVSCGMLSHEAFAGRHANSLWCELIE